jgi:uncharacterized membrane protein YbhN (UPF0104 family)
MFKKLISYQTLLLNLSISILCFFIIRQYLNISLSEIFINLNQINMFFIFFSILGIVIQNLILIFRFKFFLRLQYIYSDYKELKPIIFKSSLLSQVLPTNFGGDILKYFFYKKKNKDKSRTNILKKIILERALGFLSMFVICLSLFPFIDLFNKKIFIIYFFLLISFFCLYVSFFSKYLYVFIISLISHFFQILSFLFIIFCFNVDLSLIIFIPFVIFSSMIPLSFAGWGIREIFSITILGYIGFTSHDAFTISVLFGFCSLLACIIMYLYESMLVMFFIKKVKSLCKL